MEKEKTTMSESLADIRSRIEALGIEFEFIKTIKTSMNGVERETWLLEYEGTQFVFVAGQKHVVLGWDVNQCPLGEGVLEGLKKEFMEGHKHYLGRIEGLQEYYQKEIEKADTDEKKADELRLKLAEDLESEKEEMEAYISWENYMLKWNEHLSQCLSPLRTVDIGDMIVEVDSRYLEEDASSLEQAVCSLKESPFTLATEDEWEYLCNGGTRTLFRWGDTLSDVIEEIYGVGTVSKENNIESGILEQPNMLGLFIAYDSYKNEIIDNTQYIKGGDGGCSICGGDGGIYVFPCYTAFYRDSVYEYAYRLSKNYYCYRRIIRLP